MNGGGEFPACYKSQPRCWVTPIFRCQRDPLADS